MKKLFLLLCLLCMAGQAMAQTIIDGIYYNLDSGSRTAEVTSVPSGSSKYSGSISIPEHVTYGGATYSVTSLEGQCFAGCTGLTSITIPNSVTSLGSGCFVSCERLESIEVESGNTVYDSRENCNAIIETSSNTMIAGCKNTTIPNSVTSLGNRCFFGCTGLTSVTIPNSVTSLGGSCFSGCTGLTSITIPNSVTSLGGGCFYNCI